MRPGIDPKVDLVFKRVFGSDEAESAERLCDLINAVRAGSGAKPIRRVTILNPFTQNEAIDERLAVLDVRACDETGAEEIIEMQMLLHKAFRERLLYYCGPKIIRRCSTRETTLPNCVP